MIRKIFFLSFLFLILTSTLFPADKEILKSSPYYKTYQQGHEFFKKKEYDNAVKEFKKLTKARPQFAPPYLNIAMIYEVNKNYGKAIEYYVKYLEKGGEKIRKVKKSIKDIANLKHLATDVEFKRLKKGDNYYIEGIKSAKEKEYSSAIDSLKKSLKIIPYYVKAHYGIALAYNNREEYMKAYLHFMKVIKYDPDSPDYLETFYYLGLMHDDLLLKDYDTALKFYKIYKKRNGSKDVKKFIKPIEKVNRLSSEAIKLFMKNKKKEAVSLLKKAKKIKPYDIKIYNNMAVIYIDQNKFDEAEENLRKALKIKDDAEDTYYNLACLYSKKGDVDSSAEYFEKGIKYFSKDTIKKSLRDKDLKNLRKDKRFTKIVMSKNYFE